MRLFTKKAKQVLQSLQAQEVHAQVPYRQCTSRHTGADTDDSKVPLPYKPTANTYANGAKAPTSATNSSQMPKTSTTTSNPHTL